MRLCLCASEGQRSTLGRIPQNTVHLASFRQGLSLAWCMSGGLRPTDTVPGSLLPLSLHAEIPSVQSGFLYRSSYLGPPACTASIFTVQTISPACVVCFLFVCLFVCLFVLLFLETQSHDVAQVQLRTPLPLPQPFTYWDDWRASLCLVRCPLLMRTSIRLDWHCLNDFIINI